MIKKRVLSVSAAVMLGMPLCAPGGRRNRYEGDTGGGFNPASSTQNSVALAATRSMEAAPPRSCDPTGRLTILNAPGRLLEPVHPEGGGRDRPPRSTLHPRRRGCWRPAWRLPAAVTDATVIADVTATVSGADYTVPTPAPESSAGLRRWRTAASPPRSTLPNITDPPRQRTTITSSGRRQGRFSWAAVHRRRQSRRPGFGAHHGNFTDEDDCSVVDGGSAGAWRFRRASPAPRPAGRALPCDVDVGTSDERMWGRRQQIFTLRWGADVTAEIVVRDPNGRLNSAGMLMVPAFDQHLPTGDSPLQRFGSTRWFRAGLPD